MIRRLLLLLAATVLLFQPIEAHARVFVIGIDGGSWNAIDPMLEAGELPNLQALIDRGGSADLDTVEPVTSPVVWTSIATGRSPEIHGVTDFFSTRATIAVPTIYERLAAEGKKVGLYEVLMSWPPAPLPNGFVIPAWLRRDEATWPPTATQDLEIFRTVYEGKPRNRDYLEQANHEIAAKAASWKKLVKRFDPEIGALTFYAVDALSHRYWHSSYPESFQESSAPSSGSDSTNALPEYAPDERNAVQQALRGVDLGIGEIVQELDLDGGDSVLVVSDHGFKAIDGARDIWITRIEEQLAKHDLIPSRDKFSIVSTFFAVTIRIAPGPFEERDRLIERLLSLLSSYRTLDGEEFLRIMRLDVAERPAGMERSFVERMRQWATRRFMDWAFDTKIDPTAHAMLVALPKNDLLDPLWPEGSLQVGGVKMPIHEAIYRQRFTGTHDPTAIFIAAGGPIDKQLKRGRLSVLDVAPLVSYLAGSPIPDDLEGDLPLDWITPEYRADHPPEQAPAGARPQFSTLGGDGGRVGDEDGGEDPALIEKLRALGYIE